MAYTTIDDPSAHFQTVLWTGNAADGSGGQTQAITFDGNSDMQPDWVWVKQRSAAAKHHIVDSSRGVSQRLVSNNNDSEDDQGSNNSVYQFNSDGFNVGTFGRGVNDTSKTYVAWCWKANGGTTTTNDASATSVGTIDSVYQANTTAGLSIVTYTGTGSNGTIAHGLGAAPTTIWFKQRAEARNWAVYNKNLGGSGLNNLQLNTNDAQGEYASALFNSTASTSTVFSVGTSTDVNKNSQTYIAYCFAPIQGYSKFGSYAGNGNADGAFVYTGFRPKYVMIKCMNESSTSWNIFDTSREDDGTASDGNLMTEFLQANSDGVEQTSGANISDFLSNGFKCRGTSNATNGSGDTYIYIAFAEHPFVGGDGVPTTAR